MNKDTLIEEMIAIEIREDEFPETYDDRERARARRFYSRFTVDELRGEIESRSV